MAGLFKLFRRKKDKGNKNNDDNQKVDRQHIAFNLLAEEFETQIVRDLVTKKGVVDSTMLQKLRNKTDEIGQKIDEYMNEMISFSIKYAIRMYNEGRLEWNGIPRRESYATSNAPGGEVHKALLLFALKKAAEKGYELVEKKRNMDAAKLLEYYFVRLEALLKDEETIKYDSFPYIYAMFDSHLKPIFTEFGRLGINAKDVEEVGSWFLANFKQEYGDLINELMDEHCDVDITPDLFNLLQKTINLGLTGKKPQ